MSENLDMRIDAQIDKMIKNIDLSAVQETTKNFLDILESLSAGELLLVIGYFAIWIFVIVMVILKRNEKNKNKRYWNDYSWGYGIGDEYGRYWNDYWGYGSNYEDEYGIPDADCSCIEGSTSSCLY
jgi:hypothetical protein